MATLTPVYTHVTKVPGVCGGKACIDRTRVRVNNVVGLVKAGRTPQEIVAEDYPQLTLAQVHAALAYYYDHRDEIEAELEENSRLPEMIERDRAAYLAKRNAG